MAAAMTAGMLVPGVRLIEGSSWRCGYACKRGPVHSARPSELGSWGQAHHLESEGTARPLQHRHHPEVPRHARRDRRDVDCLDGWRARQRIWPWATALIGLGVSAAGNIGHIQPAPGHPVILADRLTAATSPVAAFAGLAIGLPVLKMTGQQANSTTEDLHAYLSTPAQPTHLARPAARPGQRSRRHVGPVARSAARYRRRTPAAGSQ